MTTTKNTKFDNEMKALAEGVYKGYEKSVPKDWIKFDEYDKKNSGFHGEAFYKNGIIVIAFRGTDEIMNDFVKEDILHLGLKKLPNQYVDAQKFYKEVKKEFPDRKIVFTGHSLGGSLAQLMGNDTGDETVTFNAFGTGDILNGNIKNEDNIRNYGNVDDTTFNLNLRNQLGHTYVMGYGKGSEYITKRSDGDCLGGTKPLQRHFIETMGDLDDAVEYRPNRFEGYVSKDVDFKDIDKDRVFTNEEIGQMQPEEFVRLENFIYQQMAAGKVMPESEAKQQVQAGNLIYVNPYTRQDGTEVRGYYRSKPRF